MPTYLIINGATAHCGCYQRPVAVALAQCLQLLLMLLLLEMMIVLDLVPLRLGEALKGILVHSRIIVVDAVWLLCGCLRFGWTFDLRLHTRLLLLLLQHMHRLHLLLVALEEPIEDTALGCSFAMSRRDAGMPVIVIVIGLALHIGLIVGIVVVIVGANLGQLLLKEGIARHLLGQLLIHIILVILIVIVIIVVVTGLVTLRQLLPVGGTCGAWLCPGWIDAIAIKVARRAAGQIAAHTHQRCICCGGGGSRHCGGGGAAARDHCRRHAMLLMTQSGKYALLPGGMMTIVMPQVMLLSGTRQHCLQLLQLRLPPSQWRRRLRRGRWLPVAAAA